MSTRETAVAGQFYPTSANEIETTLKKYNQVLDGYLQTHKEMASLKPKAVIVPHAGYVYSGFTANVAYKLLSHSDFKHIVVIGPSHRVYLKGTSVALSKDELDNVKIEVSLLTPAKPLAYSSIDDLKSKIRVGQDGVVLKQGQYQATFLSQVWVQLPSFELFFENLCKKAGLQEMCLKEKPEISVYRVEKYEE